jgi:pyrroline-5-carboxylate reductase
MSLLMIGCGKMGGALLSRWASMPNQEITIVKPSLTSVPDKVRLYDDIEKLGDETFDVIVVAVKPQLIEAVLPAYKRHLAATGCIISIAAGYSVASIEKQIGEQAVIRIMPNLPAQVGRGVTALFGNTRCTAAHIAMAQALTDAVGHTLQVDSEDALDKVTAVAGSGPGYAFEIARCWIEAAQALGFSTTEARQLVLNTLAGSMEMALQSDDSMETLRNSVTSKNGTTEAGLNMLRRDKIINGLFDDTIKAAYNRAVELR